VYTSVFPRPKRAGVQMAVYLHANIHMRFCNQMLPDSGLFSAIVDGLSASVGRPPPVCSHLREYCSLLCMLVS